MAGKKTFHKMIKSNQNAPWQGQSALFGLLPVDFPEHRQGADVDGGFGVVLDVL